ncbi:MAG: hypothetical protein IJ888_05255 [Prevotella sp.]|nr:hypothetical protein [Prevotella sp.]
MEREASICDGLFQYLLWGIPVSVVGYSSICCGVFQYLLWGIPVSVIRVFQALEREDSRYWSEVFRAECLK